MALRHKRVLACLGVLLCLAGICAPGGPSFASDVASRIAHFRPSAPATLKHTAPIPFILDLSKHKRHPHAATAVQPPPPGRIKRSESGKQRNTGPERKQRETSAGRTSGPLPQTIGIVAGG
jgi:hypothetical protein